MMQVKRLIFGIFFVCFIFLLSSCGQYNEQDVSRYCYQINDVIKDCDFNIAKINQGKIELYDSNLSVVSSIPFNDYRDDIEIIYIEKYDEKLLFVLNASLDDSEGIMIINDEGLNESISEVFDGIMKLEKIDGRTYKYSTSK